VTDEGVLAVIVTALLIRDGGQTIIDNLEWEAAVEHASTLLVHRDEADGHVLVALLGPSVQA